MRERSCSARRAASARNARASASFMAPVWRAEIDAAADLPPAGARALRSAPRRAIGHLDRPSSREARMSGTTLVTTKPQAEAVPAQPAASVPALLAAAETHRLAGDYRAGSAVARQAAALAEAVGDGAGRAEALRSLASQLLRLGALEEAAVACGEAIAVLEELRDDSGICQVLTVQALPLTDLGMHEEALEVLARGREIAQRLGDRSLLYWVHNRIGVVHGSMQNRALS